MTQKDINLVAQNPQSTVVTEYIPSERKADSYQSEDALEKEFIKQLQNQAYEYINITSEEDLVKNLRNRLEKLNNYNFSDNEWEHFFKTEIANPN